MCDFTNPKIPLRNAAGEIDYFMGAQINVRAFNGAGLNLQVNRALTSRETFEALTGMSAKGRGQSSFESTRLEFSQDVLSAVSPHSRTVTLLIIGRPRKKVRLLLFFDTSLLCSLQSDPSQRRLANPLPSWVYRPIPQMVKHPAIRCSGGIVISRREGAQAPFLRVHRRFSQSIIPRLR